MSKTEERAQRACAYIKEAGSLDFSVIWKRSATWGRTAGIYWHGSKAAYASGCGYDKLSAVVAEFLYPLVGRNLGMGCGIPTVQERLAKHGWKLEYVYDGEWEDGFRIRKETSNVNM